MVKSGCTSGGEISEPARRLSLCKEKLTLAKRDVRISRGMSGSCDTARPNFLDRAKLCLLTGCMIGISHGNGVFLLIFILFYKPKDTFHLLSGIFQVDVKFYNSRELNVFFELFFQGRR